MFPMMGQTPFNSTTYSLDVNGVHFISYSFGSPFASDLDKKFENLIKWLENDLIKANKNRHLIPWIIVLLPDNYDSISEFDRRDFYIKRFVFSY
jgi:hypothetical protein